MKTIALAAALATLATKAAADVQTRSVSFESAGSTISGTLYLPGGHDGARMPAVVVTGAWTTVKEQMPATYARELAERGFAALTFDFRGWGRSDDLSGGVRYREDPAEKTRDIRAAFDFAATLPEMDATRINGLGICASAGYTVDAAAGNDRVARIGLVAPWLQNAEIVEAVYGGPEGVSALIEIGRSAEAAGGEIIPAAGPEGTEGVLMPLDGYYVDPARGAIPEYDNRWNQASWEGWLRYHPADGADRLTQPLAIVHSEAAAIPDGVRAFLNGFARDATLRWLEDVTQFDFCDDPEAVTRAVETMAAHFGRAGDRTEG